MPSSRAVALLEGAVRVLSFVRGFDHMGHVASGTLPSATRLQGPLDKCPGTRICSTVLAGKQAFGE